MHDSMYPSWTKCSFDLHLRSFDHHLRKWLMQSVYGQWEFCRTVNYCNIVRYGCRHPRRWTLWFFDGADDLSTTIDQDFSIDPYKECDVWHADKEKPTNQKRSVVLPLPYPNTACKFATEVIDATTNRSVFIDTSRTNIGYWIIGWRKSYRLVDKIRTANKPAFVVLPITIVATVTPLEICTILYNKSILDNVDVLTATIPGKCAAPPAPAIMTRRQTTIRYRTEVGLWFVR
jgi:hypothetical protein